MDSVALVLRKMHLLHPRESLAQKEVPLHTRAPHASPVFVGENTNASSEWRPNATRATMPAGSKHGFADGDPG